MYIVVLDPDSSDPTYGALKDARIYNVPIEEIDSVYNNISPLLNDPTLRAGFRRTTNEQMVMDVFGSVTFRGSGGIGD